MTNFISALLHAEQLIISPGCSTEVKGWFYDGRIDKSTVPDGWNAFDIRGSDYDPGHICVIEQKPVIVNFCGIFLTQDNPFATGKTTRHLAGRGGWTFDNEVNPIDLYPDLFPTLQATT